jgi:hypothetical protein
MVNIISLMITFKRIKMKNYLHVFKLYSCSQEYINLGTSNLSYTYIHENNCILHRCSFSTVGSYFCQDIFLLFRTAVFYYIRTVIEVIHSKFSLVIVRIR